MTLRFSERSYALRVVITCHVFPPETPPAGVMVSELAEELTERGHDVTVLASWPNHQTGEPSGGDGARWHSVPQQRRYRLMHVGCPVSCEPLPLARLWMSLTFAIHSFVRGLALGRQDAVLCFSTPLSGVWTSWLLARLWRGRFVSIADGWRREPDLYEQLFMGRPRVPEAAADGLLSGAGPRSGQTFEVVAAGPEHLEGMARCHITCFGDQFISHMGLKYAMAFYNQYLEEGSAFAAVSSETGDVVGAVVGGKPDIRVRFHMSVHKRFQWHLLRRALVDPVVRRTATSYVRDRLVRAPDRLQAALEDWALPGPEPRATLMAIAALPAWRGSGVAVKLILAFEEACWQAGYRAIDLRVRADNARAIAFYHKMGWFDVRTSDETVMRRLAPSEAPEAARAEPGCG